MLGSESLGKRFNFSFDKRGNSHSGMNAWGDSTFTRKGNIVSFGGKNFAIESRDLLKGIDKNGNPTGENFEHVIRPQRKHKEKHLR